MKTERNNEGNVTVRDADRLIATMTIHNTTTRIGIGSMTTRQYCDDNYDDNNDVGQR